MLYSDKLPDNLLFISDTINNSKCIINITTTPLGFKISINDKILKDSVYTIILSNKIISEQFFNKLIDGIINSTNPSLIKNFKYVSNEKYIEIHDKLYIAPNGYDVLILQALEETVLSL